MSRHFTQSIVDIEPTLSRIEELIREPFQNFLIDGTGIFITAEDVFDPRYFSLMSPIIHRKYPLETLNGQAWELLAANSDDANPNITYYPISDKKNPFFDLMVTTDYPTDLTEEEVPFGAVLAIQDKIKFPNFLAKDLLADRLECLGEAEFMAYLAQYGIRPGALIKLGISEFKPFQRKGGFESTIKKYTDRAGKYQGAVAQNGWNAVKYRQLVADFENSGFENTCTEENVLIQTGMQPYIVLPSIYNWLARGMVRNRLPMNLAEAWQHNCPIFSPNPTTVGNIQPVFIVYKDQIYPFNLQNVPACSDNLCSSCPHGICVARGAVNELDINELIM